MAASSGVCPGCSIQDFRVDAAVPVDAETGAAAARAVRGGKFFAAPRRADRVSTLAPAMGRRAVEKGADSQCTWLVPNWADVRAFAPASRDNAVRRELGFDAGQLLVLYAGGMGATQGLGVVLQAVANTITALLQQPCFRQAGLRAPNPRLGPGRSER